MIMTMYSGTWRSWTHLEACQPCRFRGNKRQKATQRVAGCQCKRWIGWTRTQVLELGPRDGSLLCSSMIWSNLIWSGVVWSGLVMHWWYTDDALMMHWWCADDALMMRWWCPEDALMMGWLCADDGLMMRWWCTDDGLMMRWWCTNETLMMHGCQIWYPWTLSFSKI